MGVNMYDCSECQKNCFGECKHKLPGLNFCSEECKKNYTHIPEDSSVCIQCGKVYPWHGRKKYCSTRCRNSFNVKSSRHRKLGKPKEANNELRELSRLYLDAKFDPYRCCLHCYEPKNSEQILAKDETCSRRCETKYSSLTVNDKITKFSQLILTCSKRKYKFFGSIKDSN